MVRALRALVDTVLGPRLAAAARAGGARSADTARPGDPRPAGSRGSDATIARQTGRLPADRRAPGPGPDGPARRRHPVPGGGAGGPPRPDSEARAAGPPARPTGWRAARRTARGLDSCVRMPTDAPNTCTTSQARPVTPPDHPHPEGPSAPRWRGEIAIEQAHVDRVYAELAKAGLPGPPLVEADGLARGRTDRTGDVRDEEMTGLFERDALVFHAARRRTTLETPVRGAGLRPARPRARRRGAGSRRARGALHRPARRARRRLRAAGDRLARPGRRARSTGPPRSSRWAWCAAGCCAARVATSSASRTT